MSEKRIERICRVIVRGVGGRMPKWVSPAYVGVPDRVLLIPNSPVVFVEFKQPGEPLRPAQAQWEAWLLENGFDHWVIDDPADFKRRVEAHVRTHTGQLES